MKCDENVRGPPPPAAECHRCCTQRRRTKVTGYPGFQRRNITASIMGKSTNRPCGGTTTRCAKTVHAESERLAIPGATYKADVGLCCLSGRPTFLSWSNCSLGSANSTKPQARQTFRAGKTHTSGAVRPSQPGEWIAISLLNWRRLEETHCLHDMANHLFAHSSPKQAPLK